MKITISSNIFMMDSISNEDSINRSRSPEVQNDSPKKQVHSKKHSVPKKEVKIFIIPEECIFNKEVVFAFKMIYVGNTRFNIKINST